MTVDKLDRVVQAVLERMREFEVIHHAESPLGVFILRRRIALQHLKPGGVFGVWSTSDNPAFEAELRKPYDDVRVAAIAFFNETSGPQGTNWAILAKTPTTAG